MSQELAKVKNIQVRVFPLGGVDLPERSLIVDHINLSGSSPKGIGFVALDSLYLSLGDLEEVLSEKENLFEKGISKEELPAEEIIVACLKEGVKPKPEEEKVLLENGVKAYCYDLLDEALISASKGYKIIVTGKI